MKYKLLKETPWVADGSVIEIVDRDVFITNDKFVARDKWEYTAETFDWINWIVENHPEDFEEVKETPKPRWKVGGKVVQTNCSSYLQYWTVEKVYFDEEGQTYYYNSLRDYWLRDPTPEELDTYFR